MELEPFHMGPTLIFALGKRIRGSDNIFNQMRRTIHSYFQGTIFEKEMIKDYDNFSNEWNRIISEAYHPMESYEHLEKSALKK